MFKKYITKNTLSISKKNQISTKIYKSFLKYINQVKSIPSARHFDEIMFIMYLKGLQFFLSVH